MNNLKKSLLCIGTAGLIGLTGCGPDLKEVKDLNNDGIPDIKLRTYSVNGYNWLFLSQENGSYIRCIESDGYFVTDNEDIFLGRKKLYKSCQT